MSRFFKDLKQRLRTVDAAAFCVRRLLHNIVSFQPFNRTLCRSEGKSQSIGNTSGGNEWIRRQQIDHPQRCVRRFAGELPSPFSQQVVDACCPAHCIFGHAGDSLQKIFKPVLPRAALADCAQAFVVVPSRCFKKCREIKQGSGKNLPFDKKQRDQQTSHAAIAIEKRVYGFELIVGKCNGHQRRQFGIVEKILPGCQTRRHFARRWGNKGSGLWCAAGFADPILCRAEVSWSGVIGLFTTLQERFYENICRASGVLPDVEHRKPLVTPDESDLPPSELVETYLSGTPYYDLMLTPVPFTIPDAVRFEHSHVIAGTGHGKTQTLQHLILNDLSRPPDEVPSLVIIDSQGDMLEKIAHLALFDPSKGALADRLVIVDPTDVENPPALGLFDLNLARVRKYDRRFREQIMNGVIELYDYIFGGLLGAELTQKQSVIFRYLARLMLAIPDATVITLMDVMQDSAPFVRYFDTLEGRARDFFHQDFNDRQFADTKKQILRRLWGVLENPTFERLFSNPRNKLDMFDALNSGKIVLVNTAKDFLKAERSSILGRFFIALTFQAAIERAAIPEKDRRAAFLYIDEAADYFDDTIDSLLTQARKFKLGVVFAHQYLDQLKRRSRALESSIMTNTSIKLAGGVSSADAHALAPNMGASHDFIANTRKRHRETDFAAYVRNLTQNAITLTVPFGTLEDAPKMPKGAFSQLIARNRARYAAAPDTARPTATSPGGSQSPPAAPPAASKPTARSRRLALLVMEIRQFIAPAVYSA